MYYQGHKDLTRLRGLTKEEEEESRKNDEDKEKKHFLLSGNVQSDEDKQRHVHASLMSVFLNQHPLLRSHFRLIWKIDPESDQFLLRPQLPP